MSFIETLLSKAKVGLRQQEFDDGQGKVPNNARAQESDNI